LESHRPAEYHQTICFHLFDHALSHPEAIVQLGFRQFCKPNPHVDVDPNIPMLDILPPGWITYRVNGKEIPESWIMRKKHPAGPIASGFNLGRHEEITLSLPAELIRRGENALSFYVPKFPEIQDPYIYIYEVIVTLCGNK